MQWRIKGKKISQEKVLEYTSLKEGREALMVIPANKINKLLDINYLNDVTKSQKSKIADELISFFKMRRIIIKYLNEIN